MTTVNFGTTEQATAVTSLAPSRAMPRVLVLAPDHEAGDVLQEDQRDAALVAQLDEVRALERRLAEQDAVVGHDADRVAPDVGEAGHQRLAVERLELLEAAAVDDAADDLAHVVRRAGVGGHDVVEGRGVERPAPPARGPPTGAGPGAGSVSTMRAHDGQRVGVVVGEVVDDAGLAGVHVAAAEVLGGDDLAGRGLHQRRAAEEDRALLLDDDGLVAHRRHVGAAGGARAHHRGDLRDAARRQVGLVEEDPAEVLAVGEDLVLHRQERAAGVDEVDARQVVVGRDLLGAQVLLDRHRVVGAALDGRVVGDHDAPRARGPGRCR